MRTTLGKHVQKTLNKVTLEDESEAEILYHLGKYSIIRTEHGEDVVSSDKINPECLRKHIQGGINGKTKRG